MGPKRRKPSGSNDRRSPRGEPEETVGVRIIGGAYRGRKLAYSGDLRTRPMKDRVREALFNRLGPSVKGKLAIDLFAGTGALGFEALSRGGALALFVEQHMPTSRLIRQNAATLAAENLVEVVWSDTFHWFRRGPELSKLPWVVFCSPPYDFYVTRAEDMLGMMAGLFNSAPAESVLVVEADERFDFGLLPDPAEWDVRATPPAVVGIYWKSSK